MEIFSDISRSESLLTDCLTKTQVSANLKKKYIEAETCPVLVSQELRVTLLIDEKPLT